MTSRAEVRVSNQPLREAFERSGMNPNELAALLGWRRNWHGRDVPDGSKVRILLGLRATTTSKKGKRYTSARQTVSESHALEFAAVLGLDPFEIGL